MLRNCVQNSFKVEWTFYMCFSILEFFSSDHYREIEQVLMENH